MKIRYFSSEGEPVPAPDPGSFDEGSGTLQDNKGPRWIVSCYHNKETGESWSEERPVFGTIEEAEAYLKGRRDEDIT